MSAIYHLNLSTIKRSKGRNVVQLVAYVTGQPLKNHATQRTFGRRSTETIINYRSLGPDLPMEQLWNLAEQAEHRKDSVVGRHVIVALPREQSRGLMLAELEALARHIHTVTAAPVVYSLHQAASADHDDNPHGHLVFAARAWDRQARNFGKKTRLLDDRETGPEAVEAMRKRWEEIVNESLSSVDHPVSRRSKLARGSRSVPRRHFGYFDWRRKLAGLPTASADFNRLIDDLDHCLSDLAQVEAQLDRLEKRAEAEVARDLLPPLRPKARARMVATPAPCTEDTDLLPMSIARLQAAAPAQARLPRGNPRTIQDPAVEHPTTTEDLRPPPVGPRPISPARPARPCGPTTLRDLPC